MTKTATAEQANAGYFNNVKQYEAMIMLHYLGGSIYNTPFWDYAKERAEWCILQEAHRTPVLLDFIKFSKQQAGKRYVDLNGLNKNPFGQWLEHSFYYNLKGMELYPVLDRLLNL